MSLILKNCEKNMTSEDLRTTLNGVPVEPGQQAKDLRRLLGEAMKNGTSPSDTGAILTDAGQSGDSFESLDPKMLKIAGKALSAPRVP